MIQKNKQAGLTGIDISIGLFIIVLFVGIISAMFYNIYISNVSIQRATLATSYTIDIIEKAEIVDYNDLTIENMDNILKQLTSLENIESNVIEVGAKKRYEGTLDGFTIQIEIQNYNEIAGNEEKQDIIKIIKVTTTYPIGDRTGAYEVSRAIIR